ncbi:MAG TPA: peptidase M48, partial [bacterium]|nr:peptidase M48 [bacterium]
ADAEQAGQAFAAGMQVLRVANVRGVLLAPSACGVTQVDAALDRLLLIAPGARQTLLAALAATAVADDRICPEELELLRAVAAALAIPVPPLPVAA